MKTRNKILLASLLFASLVCVAMVAVWFFWGRKYTAVAQLRVAMVEKFIFGPSDPREMDLIRFEIYKNTQQQMLLSRFVLMRAIGQPEVRNIPVIREETIYGDPVAWLENSLSVSFPGKAEIMEVSLSRDDPAEAVALVNAVVDSYMSEVVSAEIDQKRQRLNELENICVAKERELRGKRQELNNLSSGTSSPESLALQQKMVFEEWSDSRRDLRQIHAELRSFKRDLAVQNLLLKDSASEERPAILKEIKRLEASVASTTEQEAAAETKAASCRVKVERLARSSIDVEMLRTDLMNLEASLAEITAERSRLVINVRATPRVTLLERAELPVTID